MLEPIIPVAPVRKTRLTLEPSAGELGLDGLDERRVLGRDLRAEAAHDIAARRHEELLEVPLHVAGFAVGVGLLLELGEDRVLLVAVHVDLLEERELHAVVGVAELADLLARCPAPGP